MVFPSLTRVAKHSFRSVSLIALALTLTFNMVPQPANAVVQNPEAAAKISFTFDDGLTSAHSLAAPTLKKYGLTGTDYVITGCVGMTKTPNTCHANTTASYMTWSQINDLQSTYGWEIASHTVTHPYLATKDASDGQPNVLTNAQVENELKQSKSDLAAHGITATDFSSPYGDYNNQVLASIAKYYDSHRGFADNNNNTWSYNDYLLYDMQVQSGVTVAQVKARIDQAIANKQWLILTMHDIKNKPSKNPDDYQYATSDLDTIAAYVKRKQDAGLIQGINVNKGLVTSDQNLLGTNSGFKDGLTGWTTDAPTNITADSGNNGSYPGPQYAVKFTSPAAGQAHLFSPHVAVDPNTTYMLKSFLNVTGITSGEVAYYIDEYDVNGNWISGQYKKAENSSFVENMNFPYTPSSTSVTSARLQFIVSGTGISGYLDTMQWFALKTTAPTTQNLLPGGSFETGLGAWTTDAPATITADAAGNGSGSDTVHSVKMTSTGSETHLFSPRIGVTSSQSYTLTNYLSIRSISSGEVAFYVDEYDVNGNWISGQYKTGVRVASTGDVSVTYVPTSTSVTSASLQVIVTANSNITAYFDNARWYAN